MRRYRLVVVGVLGVVSLAHAGAIRYQWTGPAGGNWSSAANWTQLDGTISGSGVPLVQNPGIAPGPTDRFTQLQDAGARSITVDGQYTIDRLDIEWVRWETTNSPYGWQDAVWRAGATPENPSDTTMTWSGSTPSAQVTITNGIQIGYGGATGSGSGQTRVDGRLMTDGVDLIVGSPSNRTTIRIGRLRWNANQATHGLLAVANGDFTAYLTELQIGIHASDGGGGYGSGEMDLSQADSVFMDVSGNVYLGSWDLTYSGFRQGILRIANGYAHVAGNLYLGYYTGSETNSPSSNDRAKKGDLYLTNSTFSVDGQVFFGGRQGSQDWYYNRARVIVTLDGIGGGLELTNSADDAIYFKFPAGDAQGREHNKISITFADDPDLDQYIYGDYWYWGLRWAGDHEVYLEGLLNESQQRLVINDSGLSDAYRRSSLADYIVYDPLTNYTYIGFQFSVVPEPCTLSVLGLGLLALLRRKRTTRKGRAMRHCVVALAMIVGLASMARAGTIRYQWTGPAGGNWSNAANWTQLDGTTPPTLVQTPGIMPGATDTFTQLPNAGTRSLTVDGQYTIDRLHIEWTRWDTSSGWQSGVSHPSGSTSTTDMTWTGSTPDARVTIATSLQIGYGGATDGSSPYTRIDGRLTTTDVDLIIGSPASRAVVDIGRKYQSGNVGSEGRLTVIGGDFEAYLTDLQIGIHTSTGGGGAAIGRMDLSQANSVLLDVSGNVYLGSADLSYNSFRQGWLTIANGNVHVAGNLYLGYCTAGETSSPSSTNPYKWGNLTITDTVFTVDGRVYMGGRQGNQGWQYNQARITVNVGDTAGGFELTNSADNAITFKFPDLGDAQGREHNKITINFTEEPDWDELIFGTNWFWGFRWAGDHEATLEGLLTDGTGRLVINDAGLPSDLRLPTLTDYITYDPLTNWTYIGLEIEVVPEPSTLAIGLLGLALCRARRRQSVK